MSCERPTTLLLLSALVLGGLAGCGRKEPPRPPIQIIPARTLDLVVQQRGSDLLLHFSYPQTTTSGTALGGIAAVELWELEREVPVANFVAPEEEEEEGAEEESAGAETASEGAEPTAEPASEDPVDAGEAGTAQEEGALEPRVVTLDRIVDSAISFPEGMLRLEDLVTPDPAEFGASALRRLVLQGPELDSAVSGDRIRTRISLPDLDQRSELEVRSYAVKTISNTGRGSAFSNVAWVVRRDPPAAPVEFEVRPQPDGIELRWTYAGKSADDVEAQKAMEQGTADVSSDADADGDGIEVEEIVDDGGIEAFHIYRRSARSPNYDLPLRRVEKGERTFVDRSAAFGESYIYAIAAILRTGPIVESRLSTEREVDYEDRFAPTPPRNLVTFAAPGSVRVLWDASSSPDVAGYFVERQQGAEGEWLALNADPVLALEFTDSTVRSGQTYSYRVLAADQNGLKGDPSAETEVRVP